MHLHQELEGYYLGTAPEQTFEVSTAAPSVKIRAKASRASFPKRQRQIEVTPKTVLLILEDFDEIRAFLVRHFDQKGYEVYSSATLRDALVIAWEEAPRVILIDYDLRGETAVHAIGRLRDALPQSYIVLIGGPQTQEVAERAILAGASKVLSKAYAISEMDFIVSSAARVAKDTYLSREAESFS
jgi:ActR/RegA family two-component response regulator